MLPIPVLVEGILIGIGIANAIDEALNDYLKQY